MAQKSYFSISEISPRDSPFEVVRIHAWMYYEDALAADQTFPRMLSGF